MRYLWQKFLDFLRKLLAVPPDSRYIELEFFKWAYSILVHYMEHKGETFPQGRTLQDWNRQVIRIIRKCKFVIDNYFETDEKKAFVVDVRKKEVKWFLMDSFQKLWYTNEPLYSEKQGVNMPDGSHASQIQGQSNSLDCR